MGLQVFSFTEWSLWMESQLVPSTIGWLTTEAASPFPIKIANKFNYKLKKNKIR